MVNFIYLYYKGGFYVAFFVYFQLQSLKHLYRNANIRNYYYTIHISIDLV